MISLFAGEERDAKRQQLNDPLALLSRRIDFAGIARAVNATLALNACRRYRSDSSGRLDEISKSTWR